jgi:Carboxypeptidase regulatory-like domain
MQAKILLIFLGWSPFFMTAQTISGKVYRGTNTAIHNVQLTLTNVSTNTVLTTSSDANGNYSFNAPLGATYTLGLSKANTSPLNGINVADLVLMGVYIVNGGGTINTPYKIIAADVDDSGEVDATDRLHTRNFLALKTPNLPSGGWVFVPADYVFPNLNPLTDYPRTKTIVLSTALTNVDFIGVKRGDVNYTAATTP